MTEEQDQNGLYAVLLQFGDGTHHRIVVHAESREEAPEVARQYVLDNWWFEVEE